MATLQLPNTQSVEINLHFTDDTGAPVPPVTGGTIGVSDSTLITATLASDGSAVTVSALGPLGTAVVSYSHGSLSATATIIVIPPVAAAVEFDATDAVFSALPTQATTAEQPATQAVPTQAAPVPLPAVPTGAPLPPPAATS